MSPDTPKPQSKSGQDNQKKKNVQLVVHYVVCNGIKGIVRIRQSEIPRAADAFLNGRTSKKDIKN